MRTLTGLLVSAVAFAAVAAPADAQLSSVGFQVGLVHSYQARDRGDDSGTRNGALLGVYIDPHTAKPWLSVLAELSYVQRGGKYTLALPVPSGASGPVTLQTRTEYLNFAVAPEAVASTGPVSLFAYGGPSLDVLLRTRAAATLQPIIRKASDQVFAVLAGAGIEVRTPGGRTFRIEARRYLDLSTAYTGDDSDVRYRSTELVVRIGRHPTP